MNIRLMMIDDYRQVLAVWQAAGLNLDEYDDSEAKVTEVILKNPKSCLVAELKGRIVAAVLGASDGRRAWVYHLGVKSRFQRQGIGTALVQRLVEHFAHAGIKKVNLMVLKKKSHLMSFYEELGFSEKEHVITLERNLVERKEGWLC